MPVEYTSLRAMARGEDRDFKTVSNWTKRADWPFGQPTKQTPIAQHLVRQWRERSLVRSKDDSTVAGDSSPMGSMDPYKRVRMLKAAQEVDRLKFENDLRREAYVERDAVRRHIEAVIDYFRSVLLAEPRATVDALESLGLVARSKRTAVEHELERRAEQICRQFARTMHDATAVKSNGRGRLDD
jgi:hypothetical protein